ADELHVALDAHVVEVGQTVTMRLEGAGTSGEVTAVEPGPTPGFRVAGRSVMPTRMVSIVNGVRNERSGVSASFTLLAERVGVYSLGPATATFGGRVRRSERVEVKVVPRGQGPRRSQQNQDPFAQFFGPGGGLLEPLTPREPEPTLDPKLALPRSRGPVAFLHATVDKTRAFVGEQVTFAVYLYIEATGREPQIGDVHEAPAAAFQKRTLLESENDAKHVGLARVGEQIYEVKLVRRAALFPLKPGVLPVGTMSLRVFRNEGLRGRPESIRESEPLDITVVEPPSAGRPPGTAAGDVGEFTLRAEVAPREVPRGGAVAVTLTLVGRGNFPNKLALPTIKGGEWLDPEVSEMLGADAELRFGGSRTFKYILRLREAGVVPLGEVTFPHYWPEQRRYATARVALGDITVTPDGKVAPVDDAKENLLPNLPGPRGSLEGVARSATPPLGDRAEAWWLVLAAPLAFGAAIGGQRLTSRVRAARQGRATSPAAELDRRVAEAQRALASRDWDAALRAALSVLEQGAAVKLGVPLRGRSASEKRADMTDADLPEATIDAWLDAFASAEARRYSPTPATEEEAREEVACALDLVRRGREAAARPGPAAEETA
ncbi:MAG TPA: BatD family protein, partial [Polyangiaceae bacterium]|nr:BatD family protein [Polyangiaceae bacterium]